MYSTQHAKYTNDIYLVKANDLESKVDFSELVITSKRVEKRLLYRRGAKFCHNMFSGHCSA